MQVFSAPLHSSLTLGQSQLAYWESIRFPINTLEVKFFMFVASSSQELWD
jgi:hypothetical protein